MNEKNVYTRRHTVTGQIESGRGIIYNVILSSDAQGVTSATFYDGVNATGLNMGVFRTVTNRTDEVSFPFGYKFHKGLYVVLGDNCDGVVISIEKLNL